MLTAKERKKMILVNECDPRVGSSGFDSLSSAFDSLLTADIRLENVVQSEPDLRQIVQCADDRAWIVNRQPQRARRPGLSQPLAPRDSPILFDNIRAKGKQCWLRFKRGSADLVALSNPNPHLPGTITVTIATEHPQTFYLPEEAASKPSSGAWVRLAVELCQELPKRYVSFNGDRAGNSLSQFHFSINSMPSGVGPLPIESEVARVQHKARSGVLALGPTGGYPAAAVALEGDAGTVAERMTAAIDLWMTMPERTGNVMIKSSEGVTMAFFWPRLAAWRRAPGFRSGEIAFMELSGLFLVSHELDLEGVEGGSYDYWHFWRVLRAATDRTAFKFCDEWVRGL